MICPFLLAGHIGIRYSMSYRLPPYTAIGTSLFYFIFFFYIGVGFGWTTCRRAGGGVGELVSGAGGGSFTIPWFVAVQGSTKMQQRTAHWGRKREIMQGVS